MIIKDIKKAQHYTVAPIEHASGWQVGDPIYPASSQYAFEETECIGFVTRVDVAKEEADICLFEPLLIPKTCVNVIAEKLKPEEVDYLLLNSR